ncbi:MAG: Fic family protein [Solirubrobacterales bacterium]
MDPARYTPSRFGRAQRTGGRHGYVAYFPAPIPRQLTLDERTVRLLSDAEAALGRLAGIGTLVPNPNLLTRPYLLREAVFSTRIEGTETTVAEVLEADAASLAPNHDVEEVVGYAAAMEWGLKRMAKLPLSSRLLRELHERLMAGVRGRGLGPGRFRSTQNWIGAPGSTIETASFVPPPPTELPALISDWERFAHEDLEMPLLVQDALLHSQFETIHPFLDGNGRLGRLLLVYFLIVRGRLPAPLLYLSAHLEHHREDYYAALQAIHESGDAIPWIGLFLRSVASQAGDAVARAQQIMDLRERYLAAASTIGGPNALAAVEVICTNPVVTPRSVEEKLAVSRPTALRLLQRLEARGVVQQQDPGPRGQRRYVAREMLRVAGGEN